MTTFFHLPRALPFSISRDSSSPPTCPNIHPCLPPPSLPPLRLERQARPSKPGPLPPAALRPHPPAPTLRPPNLHPCPPQTNYTGHMSPAADAPLRRLSHASQPLAAGEGQQCVGGDGRAADPGGQHAHRPPPHRAHPHAAHLAARGRQAWPHLLVL